MTRMACERCASTFYTTRPDMARFCSSKCRDTTYDAPGQPGHAMRLRERQRMRRAPLGRSCQWCKATDLEAAFANVHGMECGACQRTKARGQVCTRCNGPRASHGFCGRCDMKCPPHLIELLWIDAATERERRMFLVRGSRELTASRGPPSRRSTGSRFPALSDEQKRAAIQDGVLALVVPTALWLKRRV